jgi:hypothetical protein
MTSGNDWIGGLAGWIDGTITGSYSTGAVPVTTNTGGLVGYYDSGSVTGSYWDTQTSGQAHSAGSPDLFGKTTAEMKQLATFSGAGWDIDDAGGTGKLWRIYNARTYPLLRIFLKPLAVIAANDSRPYTGIPYSGGNGEAFSPADYDAGKVFGAIAYGGSSQGVMAPGTYAIIPGGLWSDQQGYDITAVSGTLTINAASGVGRVPDGITGAPLQVCRNLSQLNLTWGASCGAAATDFAVYEGTLGSWYSHAPLLCSTSGATSATVPPSSGNRYYLVVPVSATKEGSYGTRSTGLEIPQSTSPCKASQDLSACR